MTGDAGEQILIALVGQQIAVVEDRLAEIGEIRIPLAVDLDAHAIRRLIIIML